MTAPTIIQNLVNRFRDSRELYRSGRYNEAQLRQEFLNPFFEALGWDMDNRSNFAPQYREVIHEDSLEDNGSLTAPDYAFRIGTTRKFFVEAKKPAVDVRYDIHPAYQLRRYAWNAHLPLSILTDFEELAVYDCRTRPDPKDSAATGRVMLFTFEEYVERWDELAQIFSRDAVWNGSFDRYAEGSKGKRGTTEVDAEFLKEIEQWRILLARNIALRNFRPSAGSVIASEAKQSQSTIVPDSIPSEAPSVNLSEAPSANPSEAPSVIASEAKQSQSATELKQPLNLHRAERQLNYAVQTTIDRILFLRICEDRKIEPLDQLLQIAEGDDVYAQMLVLFQKADQKYNSGLFHFNKEKGQTSEPDTFTPNLQIDDKILRQIIKSTYYPCPYMFNEIPVEILGQVYEQFLGSVIRLTPGGQAKVEEKPEVRKAGGVYYTPRYIVDYIVQNTLGRLLGENSVIVPVSGPSTGSDREVSILPSVHGEDAGTIEKMGTNSHLTPTQALNLRVVDPACGSGSFLLGAYQYLLDWHLNYYLSHDPKSHTRGKNPPLVATEGGEYRLTTETKKRILTASIYGVDIDSQAVEVTKLSLLLKLLEGETGQLSLGFERVLPDLGNNIRCGNSLIGWDYFKGQMFPDDEEIQRVNPFDWQRAFPHVFDAGGFDAVIGNPPYGATFTKQEESYIRANYSSYKYKFESYIYFIQKGISLCSNSGFLSFITPEIWLRFDSGSNLRGVIKDNANFIKIKVYGENVFDQAVISTIVFVISIGKEDCSLFIEHPNNSWNSLNSQWKNNPGLVLNYKLPPSSTMLVEKIALAPKLSHYGEISQGLTAYDKYRGQSPEFIKKRGFHSNIKVDDTYGKWLSGKDISRYKSSWSGEWLSYGDWLAAPRKPKFFNGDRIVFREIPGANKRIQATILTETSYYGHSITPFVKFSHSPYDLRFFLGISNSKLISWYGRIVMPNFGKDIFPKLNPQDVAGIPIASIDFSHKFEREQHDELVQLVEQMIEAISCQGYTPLEKEQLDRRIIAIDVAIDRLVYELFGLTDEEIRIVETTSS